MGVGDVPFLQVASRPKPSVMPWSEGKAPTERGSKADPEPHDWFLAIDEGKPQLTSSYLQIRLEIHLFPSISKLGTWDCGIDGKPFESCNPHVWNRAIPAIAARQLRRRVAICDKSFLGYAMSRMTFCRGIEGAGMICMIPFYLSQGSIIVNQVHIVKYTTGSRG